MTKCYFIGFPSVVLFLPSERDIFDLIVKKFRFFLPPSLIFIKVIFIQN